MTPIQSQTILRKVLVILDGLDTSMAAADMAIAMARELGSIVEALFVVDTPTLDYLVQQRVLHQEERVELERDLEATAARYLHYLAETGREKGVAISGSVRKGRLSQIALQEAREREVSAVLIGGCRSTSRHDLAASERNLIMAECACPLILVRQ